MCGGGGGRDYAAEQALADKQRQAAEAEAKRLEAERQAEKDRENAKVVADQQAAAQRDAERRARNRTLLAGLEEEEGDGLGSGGPLSASTRKSQLAKNLLTGV